MKIEIKQDHMYADSGKAVEVKAGDVVDVSQPIGIYLQSIGVADVVAHDAPPRNAKKSKLIDTPESKAAKAATGGKE